MSPQHAAGRHEAGEAHEDIAHTARSTADIGHLGEHDLEFVHDLPLDAVDVGQLRALAQHRLGEVESAAHRRLHGAAMLLVEWMDGLGHWILA